MTNDEESHPLGHFLEAQASAYDGILGELHRGRKTGHWIWFIFPQLDGLGRSAMSKRFALNGLEHARCFLSHPVLGARLREVTGAMISHRGERAVDILGSPDDLKFRSLMTLFRQAAASQEDRQLFQQALDLFFDGTADPLTLALLAGTAKDGD